MKYKPTPDVVNFSAVDKIACSLGRAAHHGSGSPIGSQIIIPDNNNRSTGPVLAQLCSMLRNRLLSKEDLTGKSGGFGCQDRLFIPSGMGPLTFRHNGGRTEGRPPLKPQNPGRRLAASFQRFRVLL